jgi:hypothetical protein
MTPLLLATATALAGSTWAAGEASADQVRYVGVHPIPAGGVCHIELPHVHVYAPHKSKKKIKLLYRQYDDQYHFVGDPTAYDDYDGPKVAYYGHHPIAVDVVAGVHVDGAPHHIEYCYLNGPHHHHYAPPPDLEFTVKGDAHWFVGTYPASYKKRHKSLVRINAIYKPMKYDRPVVEVDPPEAYVGPVVEVHGHGHVRGPAVRGEVEVRVPAPSLEVEVGLPGLIVVDDHDHHHHRKHKRHRKHRKLKRRKRGRGHWKWK